MGRPASERSCRDNRNPRRDAGPFTAPSAWRAHSEIIAPILNGEDGCARRCDRRAAAAAMSLDDEAAMMSAIRRLRGHALAVALSDMTGSAPVTTQMHYQHCRGRAPCGCHLLLRQADRRGQPAHGGFLDHPDLAGCGWTVLALGKLGAGELNYSSDIDLILLHDPFDNPLAKPAASQSFYVDDPRPRQDPVRGHAGRDAGASICGCARPWRDRCQHSTRSGA